MISSPITPFVLCQLVSKLISILIWQKVTTKITTLIHSDHGVKALMVAIQVHDERMTRGFCEILNMLIDLGFEGKRDHDDGRGIRIKDLAYNQSINRHVCNFNDVPYFFFFLINNVRILLIIEKLRNRVHWGCTMGALIKKQKNNDQEK